MTEFIPISSTGRLLIAQRLLGIPSSDEVFSFLVIVQLGTLVSLLAFYWKELLSIAMAVLKFQHPTPERDLGFHILISTIPALIIGFLFKNLVESFFEQPLRLKKTYPTLYQELSEYFRQDPAAWGSHTA